MCTYVVNEGRLRAVSSVFKSLGREGCEEFVHVDPQYVSLSKLPKFCGEVSVVFPAINGLVSYALSMKGEDFWSLFADFVVGRCGGVRDFREAVKLVEEFTRNYNKLYLEAKIRRLNKVLGCGEAFRSLSKGRVKDYLSKISSCLETGRESKTVVFSAKMAYYVLKSTGMDVDLSKIPIPVDRRVALVTLTSGLLTPRARSGRTLKELEDLAEELLKRPENVRSVWDVVSEESGVPALLIDTPVWLIGGYIKTLGTREIVENLRNLGILVDDTLLMRLVNELTYALRIED